ncbi:MAG: hypothetical protein LBD94_02130 [Rickettsiales bacterium]|jgi:hypothetical protein|nr:hypothetical protein [Rickettsiales bacterium]
MKMRNAIEKIFPFCIAIMLWYLSNPRFNPFGILAIIPVFYYAFCERTKGWLGFGFLICFLIDFNADTLFLFSSLFLITNTLNDLFGILDSENRTKFHIKKFNLFLGAMAFFLFIYAIFGAGNFFSFLAGIIWLCLWLYMLYFPFVALFRWAKNDR